jgi:hypothetical protein
VENSPGKIRKSSPDFIHPQLASGGFLHSQSTHNEGRFQSPTERNETHLETLEGTHDSPAQWYPPQSRRVTIILLELDIDDGGSDSNAAASERWIAYLSRALDFDRQSMDVVWTSEVPGHTEILPVDGKKIYVRGPMALHSIRLPKDVKTTDILIQYTCDQKAIFRYDDGLSRTDLPYLVRVTGSDFGSLSLPIKIDPGKLDEVKNILNETAKGLHLLDTRQQEAQQEQTYLELVSEYDIETAEWEEYYTNQLSKFYKQRKNRQSTFEHSVDGLHKPDNMSGSVYTSPWEFGVALGNSPKLHQNRKARLQTQANTSSIR